MRVQASNPAKNIAFLGAVLSAALMTTPHVDAAAESSDPLSPARSALEGGQADDAIRLLETALAANGRNAEAHHLLCRVYFSEERFDQAAVECERAVAIDPAKSEYHMWLGRAYGEKADRASVLSAYGLSKKVRAEFEAAVKLDGHNGEALSDLGEFYYSAPGLVGGGVGKAEEVVARLEAFDTARAQELRGRIDEHEKNFPKAEADFKAAVAASVHPAHQWSTLASFYRRRERWDDMLLAVKSVVATDKQHTVSLVNGASSLIRAKREPKLAMQMLESYLASGRKTEEAPAFAVHVQLGKLRQLAGDTAGAQSEFQAALALARDYKPAQEQATNSGR